MLGRTHIRGTKAADSVAARLMAGAAISAREVRDMSRREQGILGSKVVEPGERGHIVAVAQTAIAAHAGVQCRVGGERCRRVVARRGRVTLQAA